MGPFVSTYSKNPGIKALQEQLDGLLSGRASSHTAKDTAAPATLLGQLPLAIEIGRLVLGLLRRPTGHVDGKQITGRPSKAERKRGGYLRPILATVTVLGAAYATHRVISRSGGSIIHTTPRVAASSISRGASRPRVRVT